MSRRYVESCTAVVSLDHFMTELLKVCGEHVGYIRIVVNNEHPFC